MSNPRRRFGKDRKATILKRCLVDKVPISDLCDEYGIKPNQIYAWQKILFDHAEAAFEHSGGPVHRLVGHYDRQVPRLAPTLRQGHPPAEKAP